ncbi:MAG: PorP/SprF family type IX secretion system membrane protein [Crocinitomicaceae bacterium]
MNIPENFDRWMFDYKEGNLFGSEKAAFENFLIQNPDYEIEVDAWNHAFIENEAAEYPQANSLIKDRKVGAAWYWSAAAAVVLLIGGAALFMNDVNSNVGHRLTPGFVQNQDHEISKFSKSILAQDITSVNPSVTEQVLSNDANFSGEDILYSYQAGQTENGWINTQNQNGSGTENGSVNGSSSDQDFTSKTGEDYTEVSSNIASNDAAFAQERDKFVDTEDFNSQYLGNPMATELNFDVSKTESYDFSSWQNKVKRFYHKLEKVFDNPVGLTNLRDPELVMPNSSIVSFNPAFAGGMLSPRFEMNYRNQWLGKEQNSQQMTLSYDNYIYELRGAIGVVVNAKDYQYGEFGDYNMSVIYSPKMLLGKNAVLEPAVKMTMGVLNANGNKLAPESEFELERGRILSTPAAQQMGGNQQLWYKDIGVGLVLNTKWFYAGVSADNLNNHFENVYSEEGYATPTSMPMKLSGIIGTDWENKHRPTDKPLSLSPFIAYDQLGNRKEIWGGMSSRLNCFTLGASVSSQLNFTALAGIQFEHFKLIYHYDQTQSLLTNDQFGSHNLTLRINGSTKKKTSRL